MGEQACFCRLKCTTCRRRLRIALRTLARSAQAPAQRASKMDSTVFKHGRGTCQQITTAMRKMRAVDLSEKSFSTAPNDLRGISAEKKSNSKSGSVCC
jgi:hypothetical protein